MCHISLLQDAYLRRFAWQESRVQESQAVQVEVHQLIPGEYISNDVEFGGFQRKVISPYEGTLYVKSGGCSQS